MIREREGKRMPCVTWDKAEVEVKTLRVEERSMKRNREREMMMSEVDIEGEEWELEEELGY